MGRSAPDRAREVLIYFLRHSHGAESLEAVARWRLREEEIHRTVDEISRAVDWLVARGFLLEEPTRAAPTMFRLNPDKRDAAEQYVAN
jgi:hypothetical protein